MHPYAHFTSQAYVFVFLCVNKGMPEREKGEGRTARRAPGPGLWVWTEEGIHLDGDFSLLAGGSEEALLFSVSFYTLSKPPPELFINVNGLAEKNLPTSKTGKGEQEMQCGLGTTRWPTGSQLK